LHAEFDFIPATARKCTGEGPYAPLQDPDEVQLTPSTSDRADESEAKYASMFERRARKGQYFHAPYLGTREFSCGFELVSGSEGRQPIDVSADLGWMLYDIDFSNPDGPKPMFYRPVMNKGVIVVPHPDSQEISR
jgi:CRISPR-associated protein Cas5d